MPVGIGIWRIDGGVRRLNPSPLPLEAMLEDAIERDSSILGFDLLIVGRQVPTAFGKKVYSKGRRLEEAFAERFGQQPPDALNEQHRLTIVASDLDGATERILTYLAEYGIPANAVFFRHFEDDGRKYLARSWLIEPTVAEVKAEQAKATRVREPWNGQDFYVAVGGDEHRTWEDMRRYNFVSAGGGKWYWKTLERLTPRVRIFTHIPGVGYVGVGTVEEPARIVTDVTIPQDGKMVPLLDLPLQAPKMRETAHDPELAERVVRVQWIKALPREQAIWEKGMFANQNSATAMRSRFTLERLTQRFGLEG